MSDEGLAQELREAAARAVAEAQPQPEAPGADATAAEEVQPAEEEIFIVVPTEADDDDLDQPGGAPAPAPRAQPRAERVTVKGTIAARREETERELRALKPKAVDLQAQYRAEVIEPAVELADELEHVSKLEAAADAAMPDFDTPLGEIINRQPPPEAPPAPSPEPSVVPVTPPASEPPAPPVVAPASADKQQTNPLNGDILPLKDETDKDHDSKAAAFVAAVLAVLVSAVLCIVLVSLLEHVSKNAPKSLSWGYWRGIKTTLELILSALVVCFGGRWVYDKVKSKMKK